MSDDIQNQEAVEQAPEKEYASDMHERIEKRVKNLHGQLSEAQRRNAELEEKMRQMEEDSQQQASMQQEMPAQEAMQQGSPLTRDDLDAALKQREEANIQRQQEEAFNNAQGKLSQRIEQITQNDPEMEKLIKGESTQLHIAPELSLYLSEVSPDTKTFKKAVRELLTNEALNKNMRLAHYEGRIDKFLPDLMRKHSESKEAPEPIPDIQNNTAPDGKDAKQSYVDKMVADM